MPLITTERKIMRKHKVSKKEFEQIFTRRQLTFRERHMQTFWLMETSEVSYMMHQKVNALGALSMVILALIVTAPLFIISGLKGVVGMWGETLSYLDGKPARRDYCYRGAESTEKLIKLAGWDK